jgi:hypothetical protein
MLVLILFKWAILKHSLIGFVFAGALTGITAWYFHEEWKESGHGRR